MTQTPEKKSSGCKIVGIGCLVIFLVAGIAVVVGLFFALRAASPGDIQARHFFSANPPGVVEVNLHREDEGVADLYSHILETMMEQEDHQLDNIPEWMKQYIPGLGAPAAGGPIGPHIVAGLPTSSTSETAILVIDLNTYNRVAAAAIQIGLKTTVAQSATPSDHQGITLYHDSSQGYAWALHKGFFLASHSPASLASSIDALKENQKEDWPDIPSTPNTADVYAHWKGNFSYLARMGGNALEIAPPKDGDFEHPVSDVTQARLKVDILSRDRLTFTVEGDAANLDAVRRVEADLVEHAGELQRNLEEKNLTFTYTTQADEKTAVLHGDVSGLAEYIVAAFQPKETDDKPNTN